jgi:hypothetical protein
MGNRSIHVMEIHCRVYLISPAINSLAYSFLKATMGWTLAAFRAWIGQATRAALSSAAKNKADRVRTSNRNGLVQYDRREYAACLPVAAKEVGVIGDDDSSEERGAVGADRLPLFPD